MVYSFDIDEKSLYRGVTNDYKNGQTATVSTPLNQSKDPNHWRHPIFEFLKSIQSEDLHKLPDLLMDNCIKHTTSFSECKLVQFITFSKFSLDGNSFEVDASFAMYVKEEISERISKRNGDIVDNPHLGRQKLHYPVSFKYLTDDYNINNAMVLDKILEINGGFAFVVNGFDYDSETLVLNFRTTMVGLNGVPLSNVFKRKKGIGVKLIVDGFNFKEQISPLIKNKAITKEENDVFFNTLEKIKNASLANGRKGEEYVFDNIEKVIGLNNIKNLVHISKKYPQSPYDIECTINGIKKYIEVKSTSGEKKVFIMSLGERKFMRKYDENYILILVTNVNSNRIKHFKFKRYDIENTTRVTQEPQNIKYIVNK